LASGAFGPMSGPGMVPPPPPPAGTTRGERWTLGILAAVALAVAAAGVTWQSWDMVRSGHRPMLQGWDDTFYYAWLPAVVLDHTLDFSRELERGGTVDPAAQRVWEAQPRTAAGLLPVKYPPGWAIGSLPFFLAAWGLAPAHATGFEPVFFAWVWLGQLLYAGLGLFLAARIIRRLVPAAPAGIAVLALWLASPLVYYQTARLSMSHSQVFVLAVGSFWLALRILDRRDSAATWLALGFTAGLLVVTRNVAGLYLLFPAAVVALRLRRGLPGVLLVLGAALPLGAQLLAWKAVFGSWFAYSYGSEHFWFIDLHFLSLFLSPRHGWFYWHPLTLLGTVGFLAWGWHRRIAWPWMASFLAVALLNAAWPNWWLGSSFGNRGLEVANFFAMVGLAVVAAAARARPGARRALYAAVSLAIAYNLVLLALFLTRRISNEDAVSYSDTRVAIARWIEGAPPNPR